MNGKEVLVFLVAVLLGCCHGFQVSSRSLTFGNKQLKNHVPLKKIGAESENAGAAQEEEEVTVNINFRGKAMQLDFEIQEYKGGICKLNLNQDYSVWYSQGWTSSEPGNWRVEEAEEDEAPGTYLQFTCPLTDTYQRLLDAGTVLYFRGRIDADADAVTNLAGVRVVDGAVVTERLKWLGLGAEFVRIGSFSGQLMGKNEKVPAPAVTIEEFYLKALRNRKNRNAAADNA